MPSPAPRQTRGSSACPFWRQPVRGRGLDIKGCGCGNEGQGRRGRGRPSAGRGRQPSAAVSPGRSLGTLMTRLHGSLPRAGLRLWREAASLRDGLAELDALGQEADCLSDVEDRVDRALNEWEELVKDTLGLAGRLVAFHDHEASLPVDPCNELVNGEITGRSPLSVHLKDPGDARFVLGG